MIRETAVAAAREYTRDNMTISSAVVVAVEGGRAVIQFAEDDNASQMRYPALKSYVPVVGDNVMIINNVIIGGWQA
jgi:hypothetical protein